MIKKQEYQSNQQMHVVVKNSKKSQTFIFPSMKVPSESWPSVQAFIADLQKDTKYNWRDMFEIRLRGNNREYAYFKCIYCSAQINFKVTDKLLVRKYNTFHHHKKEIIKKHTWNILQIFEDPALLQLNNRLNVTTFKQFMKTYARSLAFCTDFHDEKEFKVEDVQNKESWIVKQTGPSYTCSCAKSGKNVPCQHVLSVLRFLNCENYLPFVRQYDFKPQ